MENLAIVNHIASFLGEVSKLNFYILVPVFSSVIALSMGYFRNYHYPAKWLRSQLIELITNIKITRAQEGLAKAELKSNLDELFNTSPFKNIWAEYSGSLHIVHDKDNRDDVKDIYATTPAETFFSKETLIDLQINAGFYRHLPGILTGIGIIGTFTGLVWGLREFRLDAGLALESLPLLLQEVASAFIGSGFAILCSIFITYKEKDIINKCYMLVEELNKELDSTYSMGAGEEYLARLVTLSEGNSGTLQTFRKELFDDLTLLMQENTERQMAAQQMQSQLVAEQMANAVRYAISEPMEALTDALKEVRGDQRDAVANVLETLVSGFMDKLGQTVGKQMEEVNASIKGSSEVLDKVQTAMMGSIQGISDAGSSAASVMSEKMDVTFNRILQDQQNANAKMMEAQKQTTESIDESMKSVLSSIQDAVVTFAIDRKQHMTQYKESYDKLLSSVKDTVDALSTERQAQVEQDQKRTDNMMTSIELLYSGISDSVDKITTDIKEITFKTSDNFETIQSITSNALTEMKAGVSVMQSAADKFIGAGDKVESVSVYMLTAAETMSTAAEAMQKAFSDYDNMRNTIQAQVAHLQNLVATTRKESEISKKVVEDIEVVAQTLERASKQNSEHMDKVNVVLKKAFEDFGEEMVKQVRNISSESNRQLETSLDVLSGTVDSMVASVTKLRRAA